MIRRSIIALVTVMLSLMLVSCTSTTTIKDETLKADIIAYLKDYSDVEEVTALNVKSQKSVKGEMVVETSFDFSNTDASFSAQMLLTYDKDNGIWKVANHAFTLLSTNTTNIDKVAVAAFIAKNPSFYFVSDIEAYFQSKYLVLDSMTKNSSTSTTLVYKYVVQSLNWTFNETYTVEANFSYPDVWQYTMKDWSYVDSSAWAGTWQIKFYKADGTLAETINNIVITGEASISEDMSGKYLKNNTLMVKFTRKGKNYNIPATLHNGSNGIELDLYGVEWILLGIHGVIDSATGDVTGYKYYTDNTWYISNNVLTKIK